MARDGNARQAPRPTSITEVARRYHAAAVALAQTLGLSVPEVLTQHRESVTAVFIECGRCDLRVPAGVTLPPVAGEADGQMASIDANGQEGKDVSAIAEYANGHAIPTCIPADGDLPCRGREIGALTPAQLAMLLAKVASLVHAEGDGWVPLLHALQAERQARVAQGQQPVRTPGPTS
jgi:hypothetical protein